MTSDDYEPGEELTLMSDGALEVAEQTLENAVRRLDYVESLVPAPADGDPAEDNWFPKARAGAVAYDAEQLLTEIKSERRSRQNESLDGYSSDGS